MTKGRVRIDAAATADRTALEHEHAEVEGLRKRVARLEFDLAANISDREKSLVELSNALFEERGRLAVVTAELGDLTVREDAIEQGRSALLRDRALLVADAALLAERQRVFDEAVAERQRIFEEAVAERQRIFEEAVAERLLSESDKNVLIERSSLAGRLAALFQDLAKRHPRLAKFTARALRLVLGAVDGPPMQDHREPSARSAESKAVTPGCKLEASDEMSLVAGVPSPPTEALASEASSLGPDCAPLVSTATQLEPAAKRSLVVLPTTGHRPRPQFDEARTFDGPLVSVIVVSYNYGRSVARAVESVLSQTLKNLEVIVVEGGSPDPHSRLTVARLNRPRVRVLMQGKAHRAGANRNYGISQARGKYICCLDADDTLSPTFIEKAVFLLERQDYDVVGCALKMVGDGHGIMSVFDKPDLEMLLDSNQLLTCSVFRRDYWELSGGYRDVDKDQTGHVHEDWAFWVRLAALGARFYNIYRDPLLIYNVHKSSLSRGHGVLPIWQQRQIIRQMNQDVLEHFEEVVALSRRQRAWTKGTPALAPAFPIEIEPRLPKHPPTLLLALPFMVFGEAERLLRVLVEDLTKRGWRIAIVTSTPPPSEAGDTIDWFLENTAEVFRLTDGMPPSIWEEFLHHLVRTRYVDILWIVGSDLAYDALRTLRAIRPAMRVADLLFNTVGHTANNRRYRGLIDINFVESNEVRDWLLERGERPERICLIKRGVDTVALAPCTRSDWLAQRIGASPSDFIVGFCGGWSEERDPLGFIKQAELVDSRLKISFVMAGAEPVPERIGEAVQRARFPKESFHLLGDVEDIARLIGSLDLLVVPSILDERPAAVLEALSQGVPVLVSRERGVSDLVVDGETGWICEPGDNAAFARRIEHAAENGDALAGMRQRARAFSETHLDIKFMLEAYHNALSALLPGTR